MDASAFRRHCRPARIAKLVNFWGTRFCIQELQLHVVAEGGGRAIGRAHIPTPLLALGVCSMSTAARARNATLANVRLRGRLTAPANSRCARAEWRPRACMHSQHDAVASIRARRAMFAIMSGACFCAQEIHVRAVVESDGRVRVRIYAPTPFVIRGAVPTNTKATALARNATFVLLPRACFCACGLPRRVVTASGGRAPERIRTPTPRPTYLAVPTKAAARAHPAKMIRRYVYPYCCITCCCNLWVCGQTGSTKPTSAY